MVNLLAEAAAKPGFMDEIVNTGNGQLVVICDSDQPCVNSKQSPFRAAAKGNKKIQNYVLFRVSNEKGWLPCPLWLFHAIPAIK